ncbi:cerebellin-3-like [Ruditapes philippinarum]|uniref:cerebellin-3-like n=1 Tax=Ruditapes philippinarum TaxID=129788 RepID=UPI00295AF57D|nr:cerebellin-3-like [Ruditapes philippinarum]
MTDSLVNDLVKRIGALEERGKAQDLLIKDLQDKVDELQGEKDNKNQRDVTSEQNDDKETDTSTMKRVKHSQNTRNNNPDTNVTADYPAECLEAVRGCGGGCSSATSGPGRVAFHATIDINTGYPYAVSHLTVGQVIVFDQEKVNIGRGYHKSTGLFIAPLPGVYMFSASVMTKGEIHLNIVKNEEPIASLYAAKQQQGSVTMVTELQAGDEIYVRVQRPDDTYIWGDRLTSFSGCLIA